jgi:hypothetical protein
MAAWQWRNSNIAAGFPTQTWVIDACQQHGQGG